MGKNLAGTPVALAGGGSIVVVDLMFIVAPIVCLGFVFVSCSVMYYFVSFLVLQSSR